jgi:hypothetical protein
MARRNLLPKFEKFERKSCERCTPRFSWACDQKERTRGASEDIRNAWKGVLDVMFALFLAFFFVGIGMG